MYMTGNNNSEYDKFLSILGAIGKRRISVLEDLSEDEKYSKVPMQIKKELKCCYNSVDRALKFFESICAVKCLTPQDYANKNYFLLYFGVKSKLILDFIKKVFSISISIQDLKRILNNAIKEMEAVAEMKNEEEYNNF